MRFQDGTYNGIGGISMIRESATARSGTLQFAPIASDGNPTNAMRLDSNGLLTLPFGQIKFPAAQNASSDANTLDDYEEGTWTPVINGTSFASQGWYVKIGGIVTCSFNNLTGVSTTIADNTSFFVTGFPFAPKVDSGSGNYKFGGACSINFNDQSDGYKLKLMIGRVANSTDVLEAINRSGVTTAGGDPFNLNASFYTS